MLARLLLLLLTGGVALGLRAAPAEAQDADAPPADTTVAAPADTLQAAGRPSPSGLAETAPGEAVIFSARDSLVLIFDEDEGDVATLYGEADVDYEEANLTAYRVAILLEEDELHAAGLPVDTGVIGLPRFQRGTGEGFTGRELAYNLRTERGRVVQARTNIQDGFIEGEVVKVLADSTVYIQDGAYTTCDCPPGETPSYSLRSTQMKQQDQWVYTGPLQLFLFSIPTPLWLPFGFLPATEGRRSGPLPPSYGRSNQLGLYLRDWGWYWAISNYMDFQIRFGIWSQGSWQVNPRFRYAKRYRYSGNLMVDYMSKRSGQPIDADYQALRNVSIVWGHRQTINPSSDFNANVNLTTLNYLRTISEDYEDNVRNTTNSSITYNKNWGRERSLRVNLSQQQNFSTGEARLTLPNLSFSQSSIQPFARSERGPGEEERWYERITTSYRGSLQNDYRFDPLPVDTLLARGDTAAAGITWYEALVSPDKYRRATGDPTPFNFSATHDIPVSASFTVNQLPLTGTPLQLRLTPRFSYQEEWFIQTRREGVDLSDSTRTERTVPGFFALRTFSLGVGANTSIYGLFPVRIGAFRGLRHVMRPSLSFSYQPDFYGDFWGYTRTYENVEDETVRYGIVRGVPRGEQRRLSFSLSNDFATKRVRIDSTGQEQSRSIKLLDVDLSTGYNFAADAFKLSDISLRTRTDLLERFDLSLNATFSPYVYEDGQRVDRYIINEPGLEVVRLTQLSFNTRTSFQGGEEGAGARRGRQPVGLPPPGAPGSFGVPLTNPYADFSIPWSLDLGFSYNYRSTARTAHSAILNADFSFNLTPKWKLSGNTGYDFTDGELSRTQVNVLRDLGCWQMSFNWTPFGTYQRYGFSLYVKSGQLSRLLRLDLPSSGVRDQFAGAARGALPPGAGF